ncbi:hypothetical protein BGP75_09190 [Motiliproteus sp. MSK22-1]|nr:hypothetical protein BGP75_09190 [Motiliproteus sp. MSK22-1]
MINNWQGFSTSTQNGLACWKRLEILLQPQRPIIETRKYCDNEAEEAYLMSKVRGPKKQPINDAN